MKTPEAIIQKVVALVNDHLFPSLNKEASDASIRRLALRLAPATIQELVWVGEADQRGRGTPWRGYPKGELLLKKAEALALRSEKPRPLILGRDLIANGLIPGPHFGTILAGVFEAQLEGKFTTKEEGLQYLADALKALKEQ